MRSSCTHLSVFCSNAKGRYTHLFSGGWHRLFLTDHLSTGFPCGVLIHRQGPYYNMRATMFIMNAPLPKARVNGQVCIRCAYHMISKLLEASPSRAYNCVATGARMCLRASLNKQQSFIAQIHMMHVPNCENKLLRWDRQWL